MINTLKKLFLTSLFSAIAFMGFAQDNVIDQIIWVVGDEAILKSDVEEARMQMLGRGQRIEGDPYCLIPEQLAVQKLFLDQAKIDSITVTNADVNRTVSQQESYYINNMGSKEKVEEWLRMPMAELREIWREQIRNDEMVSQVKKNLISKGSSLTPSEVRKYYAQLSKDSLPFIPTTVEVQIITNEPPLPQKVVDETKARLRDFTDRINKGESFSTLAIMYSDDRGSATNGGETGFTGRAQWVPEFASMAFSLSDPTKVSNIVETEYGYHIMQLIERRGDRVNVRHILLQPKLPNEELDRVTLKMDSLATDINNKKFSFDEATVISYDKDTRKNNGLMVNRKESTNYGTPRFSMEELPPAIGKIVGPMKVGDVSAPFRMTQDNGKEVVAIVKLKERVDGHIANVSDDYQTLKKIVEDKKQDETLRKWLQAKIKNTYVRIDENWTNCDFQYAGWIKDEKK